MLSFRKKSIKHLTRQFAQPGEVLSVSIRPKRKEAPVDMEWVLAIEGEGLNGDHYASSGGKRQVTLIAREHIEAVASMLGKAEIDPMDLRRNIVVQGINLLALKDKQFKIGEAILEYSGDCHPCSRMEENLGPGGYNAMRGHGGITARIMNSGKIKPGDKISYIS